MELVDRAYDLLSREEVGGLYHLIGLSLSRYSDCELMTWLANIVKC